MCISIGECPGTAILEETSSSAHSQGYVGDSTVITSTAAKNKIFRKRSRSWSSFEQNRVLCLVAQSYPTLCDPMDCSPPGSSVHGDSPGKNTGVGCHALLQGIVPTKGSNLHLCLLRWQAGSWTLALPGKPKTSIHNSPFMSSASLLKDLKDRRLRGNPGSQL